MGDKTTRLPVGPAGKRHQPLGRPPKWELAGRNRRWRPEHPCPEFIDWLASEMASTGFTARQICSGNKAAPSYRVLMDWVSSDVELEKKFLAAQRVSIHARIENLIERAQALMAQAEAGALKKDQVYAFRTFASVIQWIAAKWNKEVYGDHVSTRAIVPVQIITNLDFGQPGAVPIESEDLYTIEGAAENAEPQE